MDRFPDHNERSQERTSEQREAKVTPDHTPQIQKKLLEVRADMVDWSQIISC